MALCNNYEYDDDYINTTIKFDYDKGNLILERNGIHYEAYRDKDGNIEIYIPENKYHTGFYLKCPKED